MKRLTLIGAALAAVLTGAPAALGAPVTIDNDVPAQQQFEVTDPGGVVDELHAHGGGMIAVGEHYYWFGEWRNQNGTINRVPVYRSSDLKDWEYRGVALAASEVAHLNQPNVERPKVIRNAATGRYVMWMHLETDGNYNRAEAAVAVADDVEGPYEWVDSFRPDVEVDGAQPDTQPAPPHMSRDITAFVDDDGTGYMISAADDNRDLHIYELDEAYTGFAPDGHHHLVWDDQWREAPIVFKRDGVYFMLTSGATGWAPNHLYYATAPSMDGPWTQPSPLPLGNGSTFESQSAHAIAIQGTETTSYLYLGDRWGGSFGQGVMDSRYVLLPLEFPTADSVDLEWADSVRIDTETGEVEGMANAPPDGRRLAIEDVEVGSTSTGAPHPFLHGAGLNSAANALDGRHETAWVSGNNEPGGSPDSSWARFDLGESRAVDLVRLMVYRGGIRTHPIEISVGDDPDALTPVWSGDTAMRTGLQDFPIPRTEGRYVEVAATGPGSGDTNAGIPPRSSIGLAEAELHDTEAPAESCPALRSDDFEGDELSGRWDFRHPTTPGEGPEAPAVSGGELTLAPLPGELEDGGPVSFVGQPPPPGEHWSATARLTLDHAAGWQQAGLLLRADDDNFARLTFTRSDDPGTAGQRFLELVTVRGGVRAQSQRGHLSPGHPDTVLVRLIRARDELIARYATTATRFDANAGRWLPRDQGSLNAFHGSTERSLAGLTGPEARIGPYAAGGTAGGPNPRAGFDYVHLAPDASGCELRDDTDPPLTTASLDPPEPPIPGGFPWYDGPVEVTLSADDGPEGSGVASTRYRVDDGPLETYAGPFEVGGEGIHAVRFHSVDHAGNVEEERMVELGVDMTPPQTIHHLDPPEPDGDDGWYASPVRVELEVGAEPDIFSGPCCPEYRLGGGEWTPYEDPFTISETGRHLLEYRSSDGAGNVEEPNVVTIRIDRGDDLRFAARGTPRIRRVGPKRRRVAYRLRVTNLSDVPSGPVRLCAAGPPKRLRVLGARCRTVDNVNPGVTRKRPVKVRIKPAARGKLSRVRLIARGPRVAAIRNPVRLRVRR